MKFFLRRSHSFYSFNWMSIFIAGSFVPHVLFAAEYAKPEIELEGILMQQQSLSDEPVVEEVDNSSNGVEVFAFDFVEPGRWNVTEVLGDNYFKGSYKGLDSWIEMTDDSPKFAVDSSVSQQESHVRDALRKALPVEGRPGDQARSILKQFRDQEKKNPAELYNSALQFEKNGEGVDAYLLYYFAARKGHIKSSFVLAEMYDPNRFSKKGSSIDKPDVALAFKWYKKAADKGHRIAAVRLKFLRHWVETSMPSDTPKKRRLLLLWKKL